MTKEEAKKWGLILLAYGYGEKCGVTVKEKTDTALLDIGIVDSGDHDANADDFEIMELKSVLCPAPFCLKRINFEYEEKEDENLIEKVVKFPKEQMYELAKQVLEAIAVPEEKKSDFWRLGRFEEKK